MSHENMLISCIGWLEVVRTVNKFCDYLRDKVWKTKNKTLLKIKACLPQTYVDDLHEEAQIFYNAIRDVAQSYIVLLNARGVKAIKAQVRWGLSGELLRELMTDDDVEFYAKEYVDSALEGWKGVLKIKLK